MKKVCIITTVTMTNKLFLVPMAAYFRQHTDWDITLMCALDDPEYLKLVPEGVRYLPVEMKRGISLGGIAACAKMAKIFRREKFDMIQYCTPNASLYASLAGWLAGVKVRLYCQWGMIFVSFRGAKRWIFKQIEKLTCRLSTCVEPDSFGNLRFAHEQGLYPEGKAHVVWNGSTLGIDLKRFDPVNKPQWRTEVRRELDIPEDAFLFGYIGRINTDKGINELLSAFRQFSQRHENAYLLMAGTLETDKHTDMSLLEWGRSHPRVRILPHVTGIERYYGAMDSYVLASYREGFGTTTIEAEAMELPVIVTDIPGPTEAMKPGVTGITVKVRDAQALLEGMETMYADPEGREQMGKAGRQYVAERFEVNRFMEEVLHDRKRLLGEL